MPARGIPLPHPSNEHPILGWIREHIDQAIKPLDQVEREAIFDALILCRGNVQLASSRLGISRTNLYKKLKAYRRISGLKSPPDDDIDRSSATK